MRDVSDAQKADAISQKSVVIRKRIVNAILAIARVMPVLPECRRSLK